MNGDPRRTIALAWLLALVAFGATFLLVMRRPAAPPQEIVRLCDALALPGSRFVGESERGATAAGDAVARVRR